MFDRNASDTGQTEETKAPPAEPQTEGQPKPDEKKPDETAPAQQAKRRSYGC